MGLEVKQQQTFASSLSMLILASLAAILRFIARARSKATFGYDDYFTVMALVFFAAFVGVSLWGASYICFFDHLLLIIITRFCQRHHGYRIPIPTSDREHEGYKPG